MYQNGLSREAENLRETMKTLEEHTKSLHIQPEVSIKPHKMFF